MPSASKSKHRPGQYIPRRREELNSAIYICWCAHCASLGTLVVKPDGKTLSGRYFYNEYDIREHRSNSRASSWKDGALEDSNATSIQSKAVSFAAQAGRSPLGINLPNDVSPMVSRPISQSSLDRVKDNFDSDFDLVPKPTIEANVPKRAMTTEYEWQFLEKIQLHLANLKENPLRFWNPAEIQFRKDLGEYPDNSDLTFPLDRDSRNSVFMGHVEWLRESQRFLERTMSMRKVSHAFSCKHKVVSAAIC
ncbi:hypothetical protein F5879DRAFT_920267 [Lentinula edodes]|nr:hypothetical protein F5879DRAFT_920267 [Lentinula edodes]